MSTAIAPVARPSLLVDYGREMEGARMLMKSGLLPSGIKSPEAALFVILTGRDLGLSPVQSLRSIHVIQGKIEVAADMQLGLFHTSGGRSQWVTLTNEQAVLKLEAPWLIEPHTESFTLADAKQAKLGGDNWQKYPKAMLRSRAITAGLKSIGFDPTAGVYAPGELGGPEVVEELEVDVRAPVGIRALVTEAQPDDGNTEAATEMLENAASEALADIESALPTLQGKQEDYVREQLRNGADPVALLAFLQEKGVLPKAAV
jgi:hypothetical protein